MIVHIQSEAELNLIKRGLRKDGSVEAAELLEKLSEREFTPACLPFQKVARSVWGSIDDVQVDQNAAVSLSEDGAWVNAWIWVSNEEVR